MMLPKQLPPALDNPAVRRYWQLLRHKRVGLFCKRGFDIILSAAMLLLLSPVFLALALWIKLDSPGPVFFRQQRVTTGGRIFRIFKFRTMVQGAEKLGSLITEPGDMRITRVGKRLRDLRIDEIPQLLNVLLGDMSFVGTRPEVPRYVEAYTDEMWATLLLPAGITSNASIKFKDEQQMLDSGSDTDDIYIHQVLPAKMVYNLQYLENFSFWGDIAIMLRTAVGIFR